MAAIKAEIRINAPVDRVWEIISDLDSEPKFWKGTKSIKNISKKDNQIIREITIAFRDKKCMQKVSLFPKKSVEAAFTEGIILGTKSLKIIPGETHTTLEAIWDIKVTGMIGMFAGMIKKHIKSGTEQALEGIKKEAEL